MSKRKPKYQDRPHVMKPEIQRRFEALMQPKQEPGKKSHVPIKKWELWRWDTLEDVPQD